MPRARDDRQYFNGLQRCSRPLFSFLKDAPEIYRIVAHDSTNSGALFIPVFTDSQDPAALAPLWIALRWAPLKHSHVTESEVVLYGVVGVEAPHRGSDFFGGLPRDVAP